MSRRSPLLLPLALLVALAACGEKDRKLKVTGIEPERGDTEGGTYVVIKGNRFIADGPRNAKVYFGSRQGSVVRFASDRELIVQAPGGKPDEIVDVLVLFEPGGQLKIPNAFKFVDKNDEGLRVQDLNAKTK
ncbi:MAG: IPT/TIG domain-containing protein [Kofleriaceae bacterium]